MRISLITPTCDRPHGMRLCERYMTRQTVPFDEWIVADGGKVPATLSMGQVHLHQPMKPGARNLASNIMRALDRATGDIVLVIEDDDAYLPGHIAACVAGLRDAPAYGCATLRYYHVVKRCWIDMRNRGSALCQTAIRRELIPELRGAAQAAHDANDFGIDRRFWAKRSQFANGEQTVYGIKGLGGTPGLGMGHRPKKSRPWKDDPGMMTLREWIGADAENYTTC